MNKTTSTKRPTHTQHSNQRAGAQPNGKTCRRQAGPSEKPPLTFSAQSRPAPKLLSQPPASRSAANTSLDVKALSSARPVFRRCATPAEEALNLTRVSREHLPQHKAHSGSRSWSRPHRAAGASNS